MSGGDTKQDPPPPPPPRSGSPFGRFLTSPILFVALIALAVSVATFSSVNSGGGDDAAPAPAESPDNGGTAAPIPLRGVWTGTAELADGEQVAMRLTIRPQGGRLRRGDCRGTLEPLGVPGRDRAAFGYRERSDGPGCPRETRVTVLLEAAVLAVEETVDGVPYSSGVLRAR